MYAPIIRFFGTYGARLLRALPAASKGARLPVLAKIEGIAAKYFPRAFSSLSKSKSIARVIPGKGAIGKLFSFSNKRKMVQLKKIAKNPFLTKALSYGVNGALLASMFKDWTSDPAITGDPEAMKQLEEARAALEVVNDQTPFQNVVSTPSSFYALSATERRFQSIVSALVFDRMTLTGNELEDGAQSLITSLDDEERLYIISALVALTKRFCEGTDASEILNAYRVQSSLSTQTYSAPTRGFESLIKNDSLSTANVEGAAEQYVQTVASFSEELSQAAFQAFFDETTNIVFDFKDIFGGDSGVNWTPEKEEWGIVKVNAQISALATDSNLNTLTKWLDKWAVDEDGKDDESRALQTMIKYQSVATNYVWLQRNLANGNGSQAANFISRS